MPYDQSSVRFGPQDFVQFQQPTELEIYAKKGIDLIRQGISNASDWSASMVEEFGNDIQPYLQTIRNQTMSLFEAGKTALQQRVPNVPTSVSGAPSVGVPPRNLRPEDETAGWAYAYSRMPGDPPIRFPNEPPDASVPRTSQPIKGIDRYDLPSGVVAYRETVGHHNRMQELDRQAAAARQAAQQAAIDARMLDQMSRVAKSTKDIEIARRSIDVMGLQRDIQNGVPIHQAIARHPMALGSGLGTALRATTLATPATWVPGVEGGAPGHFRLPSGGVSVPPASATPKPAFNPREVQVGGTDMVEIAPNRFQQKRLPAAPKPGDLSEAETKRIYALDQEIESIRRTTEKLDPSRSKNEQAILDSQMKIGDLQIKRNKILYAAEQRGKTPASTKTSVMPTTEKRIRVADKSGKVVGTVPESQRQQAIDEGYTPVE